MGEDVKEVKLSGNLGNAPVCMTSGSGVSFEMEKYFKRMNPDMPVPAQRILELNPEHDAVKALQSAMIADTAKAKDPIFVSVEAQRDHLLALRERGIDTRRVIVDEAAPLYFIGLNGNESAPMIYLVSDNDIPNRYAQMELTLSTMKHFEYDMSKVDYKLLHGGHCHQIREFDENGDNVFGKLILEFVKKTLEK